MHCWIALQIAITTEAGPALMDEAALQRTVASLALGFTPRVALVDEAVLLDVTGSLRLFGGLARLMQLLEQRLIEFFEANRAVPLIRRAQGATSLIALGRLRHAAAKPGQ
ncbi:MAG: DNA polymerase Y family protein, partial [Polaromonas sp.]|nr:DNA polymerase Y family protein [Polaromonas sp.]